MRVDKNLRDSPELTKPGVLLMTILLSLIFFLNFYHRLGQFSEESLSLATIKPGRAPWN